MLSRLLRFSLMLLVSGTAFCAPGCTPFVAGVVPNESGFDGAAHVASEDAEGNYGIVVVDLPYKGIQGDDKMGQARMVVHKRDLRSGKPIPIFCEVHYEMGVEGAKDWAKKGFAVFTAAYSANEGPYPIDVAVGNGNNQARAIIEWARRLPFVDRTRLHIDGGSQGGYMALAMSADMFPVTATTAGVPVVNWAYNFNYIESNKAISGYPGPADGAKLPFVNAVSMLCDWAYKYFGNDLHAECWYWMSPVAMLDRIADPVLITCFTGDMLVPMEGMSRTHFATIKPEDYPAGYARDFDTLTLDPQARKVFEELVPPENVAITVLPLPKDAYKLTYAIATGAEKKPRKGPEKIELPWSKDKQWSLDYCDEGVPAQDAGHSTYAWDISSDSFVEYYKKETPKPEILNAAKLDRLMQRYQGELANLPKLSDGTPANRLNHAAVEQRDVAQGLLDYAGMGEAHAARLKELYAQGARKPWGATLDLAVIENVLAELKAK